MHPSEYKWQENELELFKKIYMYYGKYWPQTEKVRVDFDIPGGDFSFYFDWGIYQKHKIAYPYSDRTYHHEKYSDREHMNMFADEFIEWLGENHEEK